MWGCSRDIDWPISFCHFRVRIKFVAYWLCGILIAVSTCRFRRARMNQNIYNNQTLRNGSQSLNSISEGTTHPDAVSPRFRTDLAAGQEVTNFCYSCKSEFTTRSVHDLMEHFSQPHERFSSFCLYCKTGKVHQYKSDAKGLQFYHDCYRSKMNYDKWDRRPV